MSSVAQLQTNLCSGAASQQFTFSGDGQVRFGAFCIDAWSGLGKEGDAIVVWFCNGTSSQRWNRTAAGQISGIKGMCMNVAGAIAGSKMSLSPCAGAATQKWNVSEATSNSTVFALDNCALQQFRPSLQSGLTVWSPDGSQYLINKEDSGGIPQIYVGQKHGGAAICITCTSKPNGPTARKLKMQPRWHPSGRWIIVAAEQETFEKPFYATPALVEGWLQSGLWVDMYATTPDGAKWVKLQDFGPLNPANGYTGVAFTPDGRQGVWSQIVDGYIFAYGFGRWELIIADFAEVNGVLTMKNARNITPPDTYWLEPGNFSPNGKDLLLSADQGFADHAKSWGQDQYILDITTGQMTNLTNSPAVWDEHGIFSPDGEKIIFMSAYPYRSQPLASTVLFLKTEFMMMDKDGSNLRQISHFNVPGYPESSMGSVAANNSWAPDGKSISAINLFFPKYKSWEVQFLGNCGANPR